MLLLLHCWSLPVCRVDEGSTETTPHPTAAVSHQCIGAVRVYHFSNTNMDGITLLIVTLLLGHNVTRSHMHRDTCPVLNEWLAGVLPVLTHTLPRVSGIA